MALHNLVKQNMLLTAAIIGIAACASVLLPYLYVFGFSITSDHERWGQFGDYVGGLLNPIFALVGFIGIIVSLQMQIHQQKAEGKAQKLALLQNLIEARAHHIASLLKQHLPDQDNIAGGPYDRSAPLAKILPMIAFATRNVIIEHNRERLEFLEPTVRAAFDRLLDPIMELGGELGGLAASLKKWKGAGGDDDLIWHLGGQFLRPIVHIHLLGFTGSQALFEEVFPNAASAIASASGSVRVEGR